MYQVDYLELRRKAHVYKYIFYTAMRVRSNKGKKLVKENSKGNGL